MDDDLSRLEARLREIDETLTALCGRVSALERTAAARREPVPVESEEPLLPRLPMGAVASPPAAWSDPARLLSLIGRTIVILGGAYLLRAVTESGRLPQAGGILLGFAYASVWIGAADRVGVQRPASGLFHGLAGVIIGVGLLWEASTKFAVLGPAASAVVLALLTLGGLAVAWHRRLPWFALIVTLAGTASGLVLAVVTRQFQPFALSGLAIGIGTVVFGAYRYATLSRWPAAIGADLLIVAFVSRAMASTAAEPPGAVLATALLFLVAYLAAVIVPDLVRGRNPDAFGILQTIAVLATGLGGALVAAGLLGAPVRSVVSGSLLAIGTAGYLSVHLRAAHLAPSMCGYLATVTLAVAMTGAWASFTGDARTVWLTVVALVLISRVTKAATMAVVHAAIVAFAAALSSGLLSFIAVAWLGSPEFSRPDPLALVVLGISMLALLAGSGNRRGSRLRLEAAARLAHALMFASGVGAVAVAVTTRWIGGGPPVDAAMLASIRSIVLAVGAMSLAAAARAPFGRELGWLAYPVLAIGGVKLVAEDLRVSSASMLFLVLGAYGVSLILTARVFTRGRQQRSPTPATLQGSR